MAKRSSIKTLGGGQYFDTSGQAIVSIVSKAGAGAIADAQATPPSNAVEKDQGSPDVIANWGITNRFPNDWEKEIEQNNILTDAVEKEIDRVISGGVEYGYFDYTDGVRTFKYFFDEEIDDFFSSEMTAHALEQCARDYIVHRFPCPEIIFDEAKGMVTGISGLPAPHIRLGLQDENTGEILYGYFNRNWVLGERSDSERTIMLPVIDPRVDFQELVRLEAGITNYLYRVPIPTSRTYYPIPPGYSAKTSKTLDIAAKINSLFDATLDNQMSAKYHIEVDDEWFEKKYGEEWTNATPEGIVMILQTELKWFHDSMHGSANAGKNLMTRKGYDSKRGAEYSDWRITELKGNVFDKNYIELKQDAQVDIRTSFGLDAALQGATKSGMGAGSGSDKREAFNIRMATAQRHVAKILSPFVWAINYNGWRAPDGSKVVLRINTPFLQTLNQVTPGKRETVLDESGGQNI
jgi:hypothetical protein